MKHRQSQANREGNRYASSRCGDDESSRFLLLICALIVVPFLAKDVQACKCTEYGTPPCAQFWRAKIVFVGRVIEIGQPSSSYRDDAGAAVHLSVEEVYRGTIGDEAFDVQTNGADCGVMYEKGKRYLLYAYHYETATRKIETSGCGGSRELEDGVC